MADLIVRFPSLVTHSNFVFVPGFEDPCSSFVVPRCNCKSIYKSHWLKNLVCRLPLPQCVSEDMTKQLGNKAIFTTNPCRIQYCTKEIAVFRGDVLPKLLQGSLYKPKKNEIADNVFPFLGVKTSFTELILGNQNNYQSRTFITSTTQCFNCSLGLWLYIKFISFAGFGSYWRQSRSISRRL